MVSVTARFSRFTNLYNGSVPEFPGLAGVKFEGIVPSALDEGRLMSTGKTWFESRLCGSSLSTVESTLGLYAYNTGFLLDTCLKCKVDTDNTVQSCHDSMDADGTRFYYNKYSDTSCTTLIPAQSGTITVSLNQCFNYQEGGVDRYYNVGTFTDETGDPSSYFDANGVTTVGKQLFFFFCYYSITKLRIRIITILTAATLHSSSSIHIRL